MPPHSRYGKAPACSLDKPGQDGIMETERALLPRLAHQINYFYADRLGATKRSARFYGEYVGRKGQAYKKLPEKVSHPSITSLRREVANRRLCNSASFWPLLGYIHHTMPRRRLSIFAVLSMGQRFYFVLFAQFCLPSAQNSIHKLFYWWCIYQVFLIDNLLFLIYD